jgi:hypothetical protein
VVVALVLLVVLQQMLLAIVDSPLVYHPVKTAKTSPEMVAVAEVGAVAGVGVRAATQTVVT